MGLDLFFPWLIILSVTYGVLDKYEVISEEESINGAIAIGVSFLGVLGITGISGAFTAFAAAITFTVFGVLGLVVLMAAAGYNIAEQDERKSLAGLAAVIGFVSFTVIGLNYLDLGEWIPSGAGFQETVMPVLILVFLLGIVAITVRS
ncbi:MAG: hypothetical protein ABEJ93_01700 [Candidatus Nanohalobium sp.]